MVVRFIHLQSIPPVHRPPPGGAGEPAAERPPPPAGPPAWRGGQGPGLGPGPAQGLRSPHSPTVTKKEDGRL